MTGRPEGIQRHDEIQTQKKEPITVPTSGQQEPELKSHARLSLDIKSYKDKDGKFYARSIELLVDTDKGKINLPISSTNRQRAEYTLTEYAKVLEKSEEDFLKFLQKEAATQKDQYDAAEARKTPEQKTMELATGVSSLKNNNPHAESLLYKYAATKYEYRPNKHPAPEPDQATLEKIREFEKQQVLVSKLPRELNLGETLARQFRTYTMDITSALSNGPGYSPDTYSESKLAEYPIKKQDKEGKEIILYDKDGKEIPSFIENPDKNKIHIYKTHLGGLDAINAQLGYDAGAEFAKSIETRRATIISQGGEAAKLLSQLSDITLLNYDNPKNDKAGQPTIATATLTVNPDFIEKMKEIALANPKLLKDGVDEKGKDTYKENPEYKNDLINNIYKQLFSGRPVGQQTSSEQTPLANRQLQQGN